MRTWTKYLAILSIGCMSPGVLILANTAVNESDPLREATEALQQHLRADNYDQALPFAETVVALVQGQKPVQPSHLVASLQNLAAIQDRVGRINDATGNLHESIRITVAAEGEYAPSLVVPLRYLGKLHYQNQDYTQSLAVLRRAQHIIHRTDGVYSLDQLNIVDWITSNQLKTDDFPAADVQQRFSYRISEVNFEPDDPRMLAAMTKLGDWFRSSGQFADALKVYRKSLRLLEQQESDSDLRLIEPLRAISAILYLQGSCCPDAPLDRALNILVNDPGTDDEDRMNALLNLADMSLIKKNAGRAKKLYQEAWHLASAKPVGENSEELFSAPIRLGISRTDDVVHAFHKAEKVFTRGKRKVLYAHHDPVREVPVGGTEGDRNGSRGLIGTPLPLCYPQLLELATIGGKEQLANYYVDFDFTVTEDGQVVNVAVLDSNTPPKLGRYVKNMLQKMRFRPRIAEGVAVASDHIALHQTFAPGQAANHRNNSPLADSNAAVFQGCQLLAATF